MNMASRSIPSRIQRFRPSIIKPIITIKRPTPNPPYPPLLSSTKSTMSAMSDAVVNLVAKSMK